MKKEFSSVYETSLSLFDNQKGWRFNVKLHEGVIDIESKKAKMMCPCYTFEKLLHKY